MKKYLPYADTVVLFAGCGGMLLRLWLILGGTDGRGLYPANHPGWVLCCILSVLVVAALWLVTRDPGDRASYRANFPASFIGAVGCIAAAASFIFTGLRIFFDGGTLAVVTGLLGLLSGIGMVAAAIARKAGKRPSFFAYAFPALFFAVRAFYMGKILGSEPETCRYLFALLADLAAIPACYQLWGFAVGLGSRRKSLFWSLTAAFLSIVSIPGSENWLLDTAVAVFFLTNLCTLKYLPKRRPAAVREPAGEPAAAEAEASAEEAPSAAPAEIDEVPAAELDPEEVLESILREIDKTID